MVAQAAKELHIDRTSGAASRSSGVRQALSLLVHDKVASVSLLFLVGLGMAALLAPVLLAESSLRMNLDLRLITPNLRDGHILGTDPLGRDLLSRILMASRTSLALSGVVVVVSVIVGAVLGVVAGYFGGRCDDVIMRFVDVVMGFPHLLLALIVLYALGPSVVNMVLVLTARRWVVYTRVARAETLRLRRADYVHAAQVVGGSDVWIMRKHVLPNLVAILFTLAAMELATVMLAESSLSFLGLGIQPPAASLGFLVAQGSAYITTAWWLIVFPGLAIFLITMAILTLAQWLGIALDPVQRWRLTSARRR